MSTKSLKKWNCNWNNTKKNISLWLFKAHEGNLVMNDDGCPTCGSKNFGIIEMKKDVEGLVIWKKQCYNGKKIWHGSDY